MSLIEQSIARAGLSEELCDPLDHIQVERVNSFLALRDAWAARLYVGLLVQHHTACNISMPLLCRS